MNYKTMTKRTVAWTLIAAIGLPHYALAGTTPLVQFPPGNASRDPAPNVIVTVDDSGSMAEAVGGGNNNSKMSVLKTALTDAFSVAKIPDDRIRLAWQSMWGCNDFPGTRAGSYTGCAANSNLMRKFTGTHRTNFTNFINTLRPDSVTPSHKMIRQAGEYMRAPQSVNSPWAANPGVTELPYLECRKTYHIFLTDGEWNSEVNANYVGNADGTSIKADGNLRIFPDGKYYDVTDNQTRAYRDTIGGSLLGAEVTAGQETLSDLAFYYWSTDLQPAMQNGPNVPATASTEAIRKGVQPLIRRPGTENVGGVVLDEYWNPRNDPASWQHITQYTIGFGAGATAWGGNPKFDNSKDAQGNYTNNNYGTNLNGYADLVAGKAGVVWPNVVAGTDRTAELWHMALNGRGKFFPARSADALSSAFNEILDNIKADTSRPSVSIGATSSSLKNGATVYIAGYNAEFWSGQLEAKSISALGVVDTTAKWNSADKLDLLTEDDITNVSSASRRVILSHNGTTPIEFFYTNLSPAQKAVFDGVGGLTGDRSLNYIRGSHADEQSASALSPFRNRVKLVEPTPPTLPKTRQADIVNSNVWYVGQPSSSYFTSTSYRNFRNSNATRTPVVYVGGNDGMLHGFDGTPTTAGGKELLAYVPKGVMNNLPKLTGIGYGDDSPGSTNTHLYYVDGSPFAGDVDTSGSGNWKTYLAGTLGAGGKGYFILDVTNPNTFKASNLSANINTIVTADNTYASTDNTDPDMGHIFGDPALNPSNNSQAIQFATLNGSTITTSGPPVLLLGNGYNSANGRAALMVHNLNTNTLTKIFVGSAGNNGLSTPRPIDLNGDGKPDLVYAGDLQGHIWKFDFRNGIPTNASDVSLVFTEPNNLPITTAPIWVPHPKGGLMLGFGTGQNLTEADRSDKSTQYTLYGIWDKTALSVGSNGVITLGTTVGFTGSKIGAAANLEPRSIININGNFRSTTKDASNNYSTKLGWYFDLPLGERAIFNASSFSGTAAILPTNVPSSGSTVVGETCLTSTGAGFGFINILDLITGTPRLISTFDTNGDGVVNNADAVGASGAMVDQEVHQFDIGDGNGSGVFITPSAGQVGGGGAGGGGTKVPYRTGPRTVIHAGWRQIQ